MTSTKRPRGRPRGSGIDDAPALSQVADLVARDSSLKPTTAMKRVMRSRKEWGATEATLLRRWQEKWRLHSGAFLASARDRARPKPTPVLSAADYAKIMAKWSFPSCRIDPGLSRALSEARSQLEKMDAEFAKIAAIARQASIIDPAMFRASAEIAKVTAAFRLPHIDLTAFRVPQIDPVALEALSKWSKISKSVTEIPAIKTFAEHPR